MRIERLIRDLIGARVVGKLKTVEIDELTADSKKRTQNGMFFCLSGASADGHQFAQEAVRNGAVALVVERELKTDALQIVVNDTRESMGKIASAFYGYPSERLKIIGVTGTNGKTTTTHMLSALLNADGKKCAVMGTLGVGVDGEYEQTALTTPDPIAMHEHFAKLLAQGVQYVAMEVSAHALYYRKTAGVRFCACIFTNLTQDHLDFFTTMSNYKQAKSLLFDDEVCPLAFINGDDEIGREIGSKRKGSTSYYGLNTPADAFAIVTEESIYGSFCMLNLNDKLSRVFIPMTGRHNVYNALASVSCALALGVDIRSVPQAFEKLKGVSGRLERVASFHGAEIFVDFAHTPDGLEKTLSALRVHCKGRLICLFGCGGNRDKSKRPIMGETVAKGCDFAVLTSDNPRFEDPLDILADIEKGYRACSQKYVVVPDREQAIYYALDMLKDGDILVACGKGGERYQEIMGIKYAFCDNDIIEKMIDKKCK